MEVRTAGSNSFTRLSNDLIAYKASESDVEVNGSLSSYHRMHLSDYEGHNTNNSRSGHDPTPSRATTLKHDRRYTNAGAGVGDSVRHWPQESHEVRNAAAVSISPVSSYSTTSRGGQNANRPPIAGNIRTSCLVKSTSGFGFTLANAPTGHMVKLMSEPFGHGQLQPGDIIVMIDGVDVKRQSHENTVTMLKSYPRGSTVMFGYVRPNGDRSAHRRPHSAIPRSSLPPHASSMNGEGAGADGTGGMGVVGEQTTLDYRTINHRMPTTPHPEVNRSGLNGTAPPMTSFHHPRTVSFDSSTNTSDAAATKAGNINGDETKGRRRDSRRFRGILRRSVTPRRSTPDHHHETHKPHLMSHTSSVSSLNFSGTPDFIPASLYRPSFTTSEDFQLREYQMLPADVAMVSSAVVNAADRSPAPSANNAETTHAFACVGSSVKGQLSEVSSTRRKSLLAESNSHQIQTTKSFDNDDRLQQMSIESHQQHLYQSQSIHRGSEKGRRDSAVRKHSGDVNLNGLIESVDQSLVYNVDIHRGSRGFGFSIRGGKEFNGMPLLVLDIAEGGPADTDGRMKNGDQILSINGFSTTDMTHERAIELIQNACSPISLAMKRTAKRQSRPVRTRDIAQTKHP